MEGRREVSIISHRPVTSSDLKQERSFCRRSVSTFFQLVVARVAGAKRGGGREGGRKAQKDPLSSPSIPPLFFPSSLSPSLTSFDVCYAKLFNSLILRRPRSFASLRIRLAIKSTSEEQTISNAILDRRAEYSATLPASDQQLYISLRKEKEMSTEDEFTKSPN